MRSFLLSITPLAVAVGLVCAATAAFAAQDTPFTANGITAVCTGVGSSKDNPEWSSYPVKIVLANSAGEDLAAAHFTVSGAGGAMLETDCDAPWLLLKAPSGRYTATANVGGASRSTSFSTSGAGPQKELTITFGQQRASAQ
ncbi:MAG: hypothetical protein JO256_01755 [Alphaproteobacteria bacterium]|nr:hypothetical protein [Alphaproteobacteria bacterium]